MHASIVAWKIPHTEEFGGATVHGDAKSQSHFSSYLILNFIDWVKNWRLFFRLNRVALRRV